MDRPPCQQTAGGNDGANSRADPEVLRLTIRGMHDAPIVREQKYEDQDGDGHISYRHVSQDLGSRWNLPLRALFTSAWMSPLNL